MTKTIVVPLDGSELAERSLPTAAWLGRELGCQIRLMTTNLGGDTAAEEAYLRDQATKAGAASIDVEVVDHRFPARGVQDCVEALADPVICMTTRGRGGLAEVLLGSVSDEIVRGVQVPVVLVGPHCVAGEPPSRTVVLSVDGSDASFAALPTVADWAPRLGLDVHVVTVAQCGSTGEPDSRSVAAHELVDEVAAKLATLGTGAKTHVLNSGHPADVIVAFAKGLPAALIAIGTHGAGGLSARALGQVADGIVRHSPCPVLVRRIPG